MKRHWAVLLLVLLLTDCAHATPTLAPVSTSSITPKPPRQQPWWKDTVFYEIFVRSFYDTNGDGVGDFNGVTAKLDYLQSLGITGIWLMPINPSPSYHGYDVTDYYDVNPEYGTMDDFKRLLDEAHKRGIRVIIDLVLNHTSNQHPFFIDALQGPQSKYYNWYLWSDTNLGTGWHQVTGAQQKYYFGIFCDCMPDLNYNNPKVTAQMEDVTCFWLNDVGVDGFRMDAINRLIEDGNKTENTLATHAWLKGFYTFYKSEKPDAYTIGEVYGADASLAKTYIGDQMDEAFNFEIATGIINSANNGSNISANSALTFATQTLPNGDYGTFLTNHDQDRLMSDLYGDVGKAKVAASLLLTSPGTPFIYYGEEIGMTGQKPDEDIRLLMQWSTGENAGFSGGKPWRAPAANYLQMNVAEQLNNPNSLLSHYQALIALRNQFPALRQGSLYLLNSNVSTLFASLRIEEDETILVLINLSDKSNNSYNLSAKNLPLADGKYHATQLFGAGQLNDLTLRNGEISGYQPLAELPPYSTFILQLQP
jgi:alpha-amylase